MKPTELKLTESEIKELKTLVKKGNAQAREINRARALLYSHQGKSKTEISKLLDIDYYSVGNIRARYNKDGIFAAVYDQPRGGRPKIFSGIDCAKITALACTNAPKGYAKWSLNLLADAAVEMGIVETISHTQVGRILKKTKLNRTSKKGGASGR